MDWPHLIATVVSPLLSGIGTFLLGFAAIVQVLDLSKKNSLMMISFR